MTKNNGFILVASRFYAYYKSAVYCAESLRDVYPEANITLFTHADWVDESADVFDNVVTDIPIHNRAKLWALSKSPYDVTMYIDADCEILHEDIKEVFTTVADCDIICTKVRPYMAAVHKFPGGELTQHMGVFAYKKSDALYEMFDQWFEMYHTQRWTKDWDLDETLYPRNMLFQWDMFTWWRLINLEGWGDKIKVDFWEDDARWNFHNFRLNENKDDVIVYHHTLSDLKHAKNKDSEPGDLKTA